jgi:hypothetical protein
MKSLPTILLPLVLALLAGCGESKHGDSHHGHQHTPPHGGTPVVLGDDEYHLEFVLDAANAKIQAYVLDSHMDKFIRLTNESFTVTAKLVGKPETLVFRAVPNPATGEKVGDTSQFEAQAGWLKLASAFTGEVDSLTIRKKKFDKVSFTVFKGNVPEAKP